MVVYVGSLVFAAVLITAALFDLRSLEIPNWLSLLLIVAFAVAALAGDPAFAVLMAGLATGAATLIGGLVLFRLGWLGGGDVKLLAAATPWFGWQVVLEFLLAVALCGGLLALLLLLFRRLARGRFGAWGEDWKGVWGENGEIPYGVAICAAGLFLWERLLPGLGPVAL
jgi:prepilin peptidase CpaA